MTKTESYLLQIIKELQTLNSNFRPEPISMLQIASNQDSLNGQEVTQVGESTYMALEGNLTIAYTGEDWRAYNTGVPETPRWILVSPMATSPIGVYSPQEPEMASFTIERAR